MIKMKKCLSLLLLTLTTVMFFNCSSQKTIQQPVETTIIDGMIIGNFNQNALKENSFAIWYNSEYNDYEVEHSKLANVKGAINEFEIETFIGTWCGDSKRELPRLYKILEAVDYPIAQQMKVYGVNRQKKTVKGEEKNKNITHVPTIIFYKKGKEVGRIVESPVTGYLEEDIAMIVKGSPLTPNYSEN